MASEPGLGRVLVAGGAGWVGSAVAAALVQRRAELGVSRVIIGDVCTTARAASASADAAGFSELLLLDVSDAGCVEAVFSEVQPDTVINAAAVIDLRPEVDGGTSEAVNSVGVEILMTASVRHGVRVFIHMSTMDVTWAGQQLPRCQAPNPPEDLLVSSPLAYVRSKARGEAVALQFASEHAGHPAVVILRPAHIFDQYGRGDPVEPLMRSTPPIRLGSRNACMSLVSLSSVVEATLLAAVRAKALHGRVYALKDLDANFFDFYQERILTRKIWPVPSVPAWLVLLSAHAADAWFVYGSAARNCSCRRRASTDRAEWPLSLLLDRHPMLCFTAEGTRQALVEFTVDDSEALKDLGPYRCEQWGG